MKLTSEMFEPAKINMDESEKINRKSLTFWQDAWIRLKKNRGAIGGLFVIIFIIFMSLVGPYFNEHGIDDQNIYRKNLPPKVPVLETIVPWLGFTGNNIKGEDEYARKYYKNLETAKEYREIRRIPEGETDQTLQDIQEFNPNTDYFWFGTDDLGRDVFTRVWYGTRISLYIAFLVAFIDLIIGVVYGGVSAYYGGRIDNVMQRIVEILIGIPNLILIIFFILVLDPGILSITLAMVITGWVGMSRIVRGQLLKLKEQEFVLASRTLGASDSRLIFKHLIPNTLGPIIITVMFTVPGAIFFEAFLSFIGLGLQPPIASLGVIVNDGFKWMTTYPHTAFVGSAVISALMISFNIFGDGLRDALDPKMRT
ncbi:peptide ABC transporter permease [Lottiidibacillus patelloidae]|uniref:Peptide ABC transporter permease n=1 Tax=Lottiidibacillus patelloidae TaxID=2670334 RepID=A0A263BYF2_9BACI|nr:oligopeptide ABC transporter permease [Lottiidibacillus patelloidae]OZM58749.1 peptide ABC transporter permease [Lottiidibacillus patelloidae]